LVKPAAQMNVFLRIGLDGLIRV